MRYLILSFLMLSACAFHPVYVNQAYEHVCVASIPDESGYQMKKQLQQHFPETNECYYTLVVDRPTHSYSDQSISDKDFITMQQIRARTSFKLLNKKKEVVLKNTVSALGSSAITSNPYASVVASDKTTSDLTTLLAEQIALHVSAFLDEDQK